MENATKALLIAAAVLVAILIISLGLVVYNMASEAMEGADLSAAEVEAFNDQFDKYNGQKRGSEVNAMLKTVVNSNLSENAKGSGRIVQVTGSATVTTQTTTIPSVSTAQMYTVTVTHGGAGGLVNTIVITPVNS